MFEPKTNRKPGNYAKAFYSVPRYFKETPVPTSYIKSLKLSDVDWEALGSSLSPYLFMGVWDSSDSHWVSYFTHAGKVEYGIHEPAHVYEFINEGPDHMPDTHAKAAQISINATEATASSSAHVWVGAATVELGDSEPPEQPKGIAATSWVNQTAPPLSFSATDTVAMEGKQSEEWSPKCATQTCALSAEWTLSTAGLAEGKHTVEVIAKW